MASWRQASKAERLKAQEKVGRPSEGSGSRRVPTPPPPPQRSQAGYPPGDTPKTGYPPYKPAEDPEAHWMDNLQDSRQIGQRPPLQRHKSESARGDPSGATSSGSAPRLALEANSTASADFNDKQPDHKWIIVPAHDNPAQFDVRIADCASQVAKTSGLGDCKGTLCFLQFMNCLEAELEKILADDYTYQPDWRMRWWQIIKGSRTVQFKFAWLHDQYAQCSQHASFSDK